MSVKIVVAVGLAVAAVIAARGRAKPDDVWKTATSAPDLR